MWVGFVQDSNPNERIGKLRQQIIDRHSVMFESISDLRNLKEKLTDRLEIHSSWHLRRDASAQQVLTNAHLASSRSEHSSDSECHLLLVNGR